MLSLLAIVALQIAPVPPPQPAPTEAVATSARFPNSAYFLRCEIAAALGSMDVARLAAAANRLAQLGYVPRARTLAQIAQRLPASEAEALRRRFVANRLVRSAARPIASIGPEQALVEAVAWDAPRHRLFATAVLGRALLVSDGQQWRKVPDLDVGGLSGVAIDAPRRLLWLSSTSTRQTPDRLTAFRGLVALDLDTLREVRRVAVTNEGSPFDLAVGPDGTVYASESQRGLVYRLGLGDQSLSILVRRGALTSPQGLVPASDGKRLYVADYAMGVMVVNLADGSVAPLPSTARTMLDGVDGLVGHRGDLIAIQNGTSPRRILRLVLDSAGSRIQRVDVLESEAPGWGEPTNGVIRDDELLYVDGQGPRYDFNGKLIGKAPLAPTVIRALPLGGKKTR